MEPTESLLEFWRRHSLGRRSGNEPTPHMEEAHPIQITQMDARQRHTRWIRITDLEL